MTTGTKETRFTIYQFTDLHINKIGLISYKQILNKVLDYISDNHKCNKSTDFIILITGDIFNNNVFDVDCRKAFMDFIEKISDILDKYTVHFIFCVGNHDMNAFTDLTKRPSRSPSICSFLDEIKKEVVKKTNAEIDHCKSINGICSCSAIINNKKYKSIPDDFLKTIYYNSDNKSIKKIVSNRENCIIFNDKKPKSPSDCIKDLMITASDNVDVKLRNNIKNTFSDPASVCAELLPISTYANFVSLFEEIERNLKLKKDKYLITFIPDFTNTEGYETIILNDNRKIGIVNINTSWMSTLGDHLNVGNMYITDIKKFIEMHKDFDDGNYNVLIFHHPLEYITQDCLENKDFIFNNIPPINKVENTSINNFKFNIGYCGHIHSIEQIKIDDPDSDNFKSLKTKNIKMPGALIPQIKTKSEKYKTIPASIIKKNSFIKRDDYSTKDFLFNDIAFFETNVILSSNNIKNEKSYLITLTNNS